jgi:two-component system response regulator AtoC
MESGDNRQTQPLLLVVEDDESLRRSLELTLSQAGYRIIAVGTAEDALAKLEQQPIELVLSDLMMPGMDGVEFIRRARELRPDSPLVLMSALGNHDFGLKGIEAGASDFISKPFSIEDVVFSLKKAEHRSHAEPPQAAAERTPGSYSFSNIVAQSSSMKAIFETVKRLANYNTTIMITGESGTGKELLARAIHHNSPRRGQPFVAINCGAIPENLMESELFGHKAGAFTDATRDKRGLLEEASGGTIFLDEIGELPLHLQVKLLRVLQEQQIRRVGDERLIDIDVRVIAATLRNLEDDVQTGRFRDDLFYRLNVVSIHIPPLRERPEDIPVLIQNFMKKHGKRLGIGAKKISPEVLKALQGYHWKGNVRELENCMERALVLAEKESIDLDDLPDSIRQSGRGEGQAPMALIHGNELSIKKATTALEINLILKALKKTNGNRTHAARVLEISHRALLYKLKEYGLTEGGSSAASEEQPPE